MKTQINEIKRMQQLAGILKEGVEENIEEKQMSSRSQKYFQPKEIQGFIDKNPFLKGKVKAIPHDLIEGGNFVLLISQEAANHIAIRHSDGTKPGSLFNSGINLRDVVKKVLSIPPSEESGGRVKWLAVDTGTPIGEMGVAKASPEEVEKMEDYTMPDGAKEQVKISSGKRKPTNEINLITAELGKLKNGKKALSLITMFPGGNKVDGVEIPMNRNDFASKGLYFIVDKGGNKEEMNEGEGLQYFHNGSEMNQIINYDDSDITDDLESFGQGSMDGQDFRPGKIYNIGGQNYKVEPQGDEFKLVLAESFSKLDEIVDRALAKMRKQLNENLIQSDFETMIDNFIDETIENSFYGSGPSDEDEEEQLRNIVVAKAQEELKKKYPGIEVGVQLTNKGNQYYTVEDEEKNIPYLEYTRS